MKCNCLIIFLLISSFFVAQTLNAQNLTGRVRAAPSGATLAGATIALLHSGRSTATNPEGYFSITLPAAPDTLQVSYVGYITWRIPISPSHSKSIDILLYPSASGMQEILVSTGYENVARERVTGSFTHIDNKTLNLQTGTTILERLNGVASSVLFDDTKTLSSTKKLNFNVRGLSSINGPLDPLIVLDNFPYEGNLGNINPADIESVTILKDAAATSIWGTRAGNGVIVISTKKGRLNAPVRVQLSASTIITEKPDLHYLPVMKNTDYLKVEEMLFQNGYFDNLLSGPGYPALTPGVEILTARRAGTISSADSASAMNKLAATDSRDQFLKYIYQQAVTQQYNLQLSGGSGNIAWLVSGSLDRATGQTADKWQRVGLHFENTYKPFKNLAVSLGLYYSGTTTTNGKPTYGSLSANGRALPYLSLADAAGNPLPVATAYRPGFTDTAGAGKLLDWNYYPLTDYLKNTSRTNLGDLLSKLSVRYELLPGLSIEAIYQLEKQQTTGRNLQSLDSYGARSFINLFSTIDPATGIVNYGVPPGAINTLSAATVESHNSRATLSYQNRFSRHSIAVLAGAEFRQARFRENGYTVYGYDDNQLTYSNTNFVQPQPTYFGASAMIPSGIGFEDKMQRFVSYFGNFAYTFRDKYILSGSARKDASNVFGVNSNQKWRPPFWSIGTAWNLSDENWYHSPFFPTLKLRATYGFSGNVDLARAASTTMIYQGPNYLSNLTQGLITQFANPDLRWEKVGQYNIGIDFRSRGDILSGSLEWYHKNGTDLYGPELIDYTAGLGQPSVVRNAASMRGQGIDLSLSTLNINGNFKWQTTWLLNYNTGKTTKYYLEGTSRSAGYFVGLGNGKSITTIEGKPLYALISYKSGGLNSEGNPQGYLNGQLSTSYIKINRAEAKFGDSSNLVFHGAGTPPLWGSFGNSFSYKGFSLFINITYKLGYYLRKPTISYDALFSQGAGHADFALRWQKPGDELITNVPSMVYPSTMPFRDQFYGSSSVNTFKGDHVRLQFINLSYDWQPRSLGMQALRIFVNAANLGILWKANHYALDPDAPSSVPLSRNWTLGLTVTF
jgi:TonB-dependent starch-binding outer membrane protein SusC